MSVHEDFSRTTCAIFTNFLCMLPMAVARSSSCSWRNPKGRGSFGGFLPHWQYIVQHSIWDPYKNGWTDWDAVWDDEWAWPEEQCVMWGWRSPKGNGQFWGKTCPTSRTPLIIANWTSPCSGMHMIGADVWLQVLEESVGLHTAAKSYIYDCLVTVNSRLTAACM